MKGILTGLFEKRYHPSQPPPEWLSSMGNWGTLSSVDVTPESARKTSAVFACIRVLAESVASLPFHLYERLNNGGKRRAENHPLAEVLHNLGNREMTSFTLRETITAHICSWGNGICEIETNQAGQVVGLWPLRPDMTILKRENGKLRYYVLMPGSMKNVILPKERVLHIPGLSINGYWGLSPIQEEKQTIGISLATDEFGARFFANDATPGGILEHPGELDDEAHKRMKKSWNEAHEGLSNKHRIAILEEGTSYKQIGIPPEDAQFLETRKYQINDIARIFRVPPHMIGDLERATFSNIEHQSIDFVVHTLRPWLLRWEQAIYKDLLTPKERKKYFAEYLVDGLLRGDIQSRYQAYASAKQNGWLSTNDIRQKENMNPVDGGDVYMAPLNMVPVNDLGKIDRSASTVEKRDLVEFEERSKQSALIRRRTMLSYRTMYQDVLGRIYRREKQDILRSTESIFRKRSETDFLNWMDTFYRDHQQFVIENLAPVSQSYSELIAVAAAEEVNFEEFDQTHLQRFVTRYLRAYASRHAFKSQEIIEKRLEDARTNGKDMLNTLREELETWDSRRSASAAQAETVRTNGAVSVMTYGLAGMSILVWRTFGDSCPYCKKLDGKRIAMDSWFLVEGEAFQPEGAISALKPGRNIKHPPAHDGCDCLIGVGR